MLKPSLAVILTVVGLLLAGCGSGTVIGTASPPSATSASSSASVASPWASEPIDTVATGAPPPFPQTLAHWTLSGQWSDLPRAFVEADQSWTVTVGPNAQPFPATMNGCGDGRFLVRWRAVTDGVNVRAAEARLDSQGAVYGQVWKQAEGHSGWMDLDGCYAPVFRMANALSDGTNLVDVTVEVQEYQPAP